LKGRHFDDIDDIRINTTAALKAIPKTSYKIVWKGGLALVSVYNFPREVL
jgi:hypothetical protein